VPIIRSRLADAGWSRRHAEHLFGGRQQSALYAGAVSPHYLLSLGYELRDAGFRRRVEALFQRLACIDVVVCTGRGRLYPVHLRPPLVPCTNPCMRPVWSGWCWVIVKPKRKVAACGNGRSSATSEVPELVRTVACKREGRSARSALRCD
jgi:hypothetical protein